MPTDTKWWRGRKAGSRTVCPTSFSPQSECPALNNETIHILEAPGIVVDTLVYNLQLCSWYKLLIATVRLLQFPEYYTNYGKLYTRYVKPDMFHNHNQLILSDNYFCYAN